jgi:hypothetical protein
MEASGRLYKKDNEQSQMRVVFPVNHYKDEAFVERKIEITRTTFTTS